MQTSLREAFEAQPIHQRTLRDEAAYAGYVKRRGFPMVISKLDAAQVQLDFAIKHFFEGEHICAVTLAGAAEAILDGLLKANGEQSPLEFLHDWYQESYKIKLPKKEFSREIANPARNWLKHADDDAHTQCDITEKDTILMIMRALPCYYKLTGKHTEPMEHFFRHVHAHMDQIDALFS